MTGSPRGPRGSLFILRLDFRMLWHKFVHDLDARTVRALGGKMFGYRVLAPAEHEREDSLAPLLQVLHGGSEHRLYQGNGRLFQLECGDRLPRRGHPEPWKLLHAEQGLVALATRLKVRHSHRKARQSRHSIGMGTYFAARHAIFAGSNIGAEERQIGCIGARRLPGDLATVRPQPPCGERTAQLQAALAGLLNSEVDVERQQGIIYKPFTGVRAACEVVPL